MTVRSVYDATFSTEALRSTLPVLVEFWLRRDPACLQFAPTLEAFDAEHGDKIEVIRVNVDAEFDTATRYAVRSVPTLVLLVKGAEQARWVGARTREQLENDLAGYLD
ncbi:MAG: thioredoxin family protein [Actinomycetes bacterium]